MLTVTKWEEIRHNFYLKDKSIRDIARETGHARQTVQKMVDAQEPPIYTRTEPYTAPKLGPYKEQIKKLLAQNKTLPRKQRWTSPTIYEEVVKAGFSGSESTVRHYIAQVRKETKRMETFLPLAFDPGTDAQVDWGEAEVILQGIQTKVQLFVMKLSYSRRTFVMAFPSQKQESFFLGHVKAFDFFGGIPQRLSYDNLKTAVKEVLTGKGRVEQDAFTHFRGHYLFDSHFCAPGSGHEKGGVEHSVGFSRRRFFVPMPDVVSFDSLNAALLQKCLAQDSRQVSGQPAPIGEMWQEEKVNLRPLPPHHFDCCQHKAVRLNQYGQIQLETNRYSVPVDEARQTLTVKAYPFVVEIYRSGKTDPIAVHPRCYEKEAECLDPLHYLPLLKQRPGALNHAKPIRQWRDNWPPVFHDLLAHLQTKWPEGRGTREFVDILYLHLKYSADEIEQAVTKALAHGAAHLDGVQLWLTQQKVTDPLPAPADLAHQPYLNGIGNQAVQASVYDALVGGGS
jgi:transposase